MWSGKCPVGEMSVRGNVLVGKCPVGEVLLGNYPVGELSVRGNVHRGSFRRGSVSRGIALGEVSVRELAACHIFLQATFFSFTIYNQCSLHLIQSFDFQLNFAQNMQLVTFLLIVVLLFTTKNDPFLSTFHNV